MCQAHNQLLLESINLMDCPPVEVLRYIFYYLDPKSLGNCGAVSSYWRCVAHDDVKIKI